MPLSTHPQAYDVPILSARYARYFVRFMEQRGIGRGTSIGSMKLDNLSIPNTQMRVYGH